MSAPAQPKPDKISRESYRRVARLFRPERAMVIWTLVAVLFGVVFGLLPALFTQRLFDDGIIKKDMDASVLFSLLIIGATILGAGATLLYGYWSVLIGQRIMHDLRVKLFEHLQGMSLRFFTSTRTGEIQSRLISDVSGVQGVVSSTMVDAVSNIAIVISSLIAMFYVDWRLTLIAVGLIPVFMGAGQWLGEWGRKIRKGTAEQTAEINSMMQEMLSVSGALLVKTTNRRDQLMANFSRESRGLADWQVKAQLMQYVFFAMIRTVTALIPAIIYWFAAWLMIKQGDQSLTVGKLIAFTGLQVRMFFPLSGIMSNYVEVLSSFALFDRIFEYLDLKQEIVAKPDARTLSPADARGRITYDNIFFKYEDTQEHWTLNDVSFQADPGQLIALVGASGSGKTTLSYLLPRLYDPVSGSVKIDGIDVRDLSMESLTNLIAVVTQETYLVHDTVRENLKYANPDATDEQIIQACKGANIWDHIQGLENGLDTIVGERGYKFSGGEKQRLAIARAILKNPKILILDEATSALDTTSERIIQASMNDLMEGRTTIAIAHRLSTIVHADLILVLQKGVVVERGRHEDLLAQGGLYQKLYEEQFQKRPDPVMAE